MSRIIDPDTWTPPPPPPPCALPDEGAGGGERLRGTLYGSQLYAQPRHAAVAAQIRAFSAPSSAAGPLNLEIGVDRGYRILCHARRWPAQRWLGIEIRRTVLPAAAAAPPNCLLLRGDVRALLAAGLLPVGGLARVDILFPTPSHDPRHLLLTPEVVALLAHHLAPEGVLLFATDVPGMAALAEARLSGWSAVPEPPSGPTRSRREQACEREGRRVWRGAWQPPSPPPPRPDQQPPVSQMNEAEAP